MATKRSPAKRAVTKRATARRATTRRAAPSSARLLEKKPGPSYWVDSRVDARKGPNRDSSTGGPIPIDRNRIEKEHMRGARGGDPSVRRVRPDRGEIPVEENVAPGIMRVYEPKKRKRAA